MRLRYCTYTHRLPELTSDDWTSKTPDSGMNSITKAVHKRDRGRRVFAARVRPQLLQLQTGRESFTEVFPRLCYSFLFITQPCRTCELFWEVIPTSRVELCSRAFSLIRLIFYIDSVSISVPFGLFPELHLGLAPGPALGPAARSCVRSAHGCNADLAYSPAHGSDHRAVTTSMPLTIPPSTVTRLEQTAEELLSSLSAGIQMMSMRDGGGGSRGDGGRPGRDLDSL
ncbi:hypothetical protein EVAR_75517_1 [Eumeta japonica]|uniref:Uncharacterized protein n=1 Tax=Eumeta variegata TaxID=151549 RepID=A0A4C1UIY5_EUMVA|nr:hypothetical protein EVAR_75517_1 [Eumeta japonica]